MNIEYTKRIDLLNPIDLNLNKIVPLLENNVIQVDNNNLLNILNWLKDFQSITEQNNSPLNFKKNSPSPSYDVYKGLFLATNEMAGPSEKLWQKNILQVYFFKVQPVIKNRVIEYYTLWSQHCRIQFRETTNINEADIRVSFEDSGSWSYIGTDAQNIKSNLPTVNFGWLSETLPDKDFKRVVLHEFGHVLGLIHEHQSPAVTINWNKPFVYKHFKDKLNWGEREVDVNIFQEFEKSNTQYSTLDKKSIMAYHIPPEFTLDNTEFPLNYDLSEMDKQFIGEMYPQVLHS